MLLLVTEDPVHLTNDCYSGILTKLLAKFGDENFKGNTRNLWQRETALFETASALSAAAAGHTNNFKPYLASVV
jgi:hypothetical protein